MSDGRKSWSDRCGRGTGTFRFDGDVLLYVHSVPVATEQISERSWVYSASVGNPHRAGTFAQISGKSDTETMAREMAEAAAENLRDLMENREERGQK